MAKKFYWLKLHRDFFKRHDIRIIEEMENGKDYLLFYLKLLVESLDHEGYLRFSDTVPYNEKMLAVVTNTNVDIVRSALKVFESLNMVEVLEDETLYMTEVEKMIGSETEWAEKKRIYRENQRTIQGQKKTLSDKSKSIEKEIEIEIEKEYIESDKSDSLSDRSDYKAVMNMWNELDGLGNIKGIKKISSGSKRYINLQARLKTFTVDDFRTAIDNIKQSKFLQGENKSGWAITFDWFVLPSNFPKVLEGNYNDTKNSTADTGSKLERWLNGK